MISSKIYTLSLGSASSTDDPSHAAPKPHGTQLGSYGRSGLTDTQDLASIPLDFCRNRVGTPVCRIVRPGRLQGVVCYSSVRMSLLTDGSVSPARGVSSVPNAIARFRSRSPAETRDRVFYAVASTAIPLNERRYQRWSFEPDLI